MKNNLPGSFTEVRNVFKKRLLLILGIVLGILLIAFVLYMWMDEHLVFHTDGVHVDLFPVFHENRDDGQDMPALVIEEPAEPEPEPAEPVTEPVEPEPAETSWEEDLAPLRARTLVFDRIGDDEYISSLCSDESVNAVVILLKNTSGRLSYRSGVWTGSSSEDTDTRLRTVIGTLHDSGKKVIGRVSALRDNMLPFAREDCAVLDEDGDIWRDDGGIPWLDPEKEATGDVLIALLTEIEQMGFDEVFLYSFEYPTSGIVRQIHWEDGVERVANLDKLFIRLRDAVKIPLSVEWNSAIGDKAEDSDTGQHAATYTEKGRIAVPLSQNDPDKWNAALEGVYATGRIIPRGTDRDDLESYADQSGFWQTA